MTEFPVCPVCGAHETLDDQCCRHCGHEFVPEDLPEDVQPVHAGDDPTPDRPGSWLVSFLKYTMWGFIAFLPVFVIIGLLGAITVPGYLAARRHARKKACYASQRVLLGAIEMYNMDHSEPQYIRFIDATTEKSLMPGYLKSPLLHPEAGCAYSATDDITASGVISCALHGPVE